MKNIIKIISSLIIVLVVFSCSDEFLTNEPQGQFSSSGLATEEGVDGILIGAYKMLSGTGLDGQAPWENDVQNWVFGGIASDDAYKGTDAGDQPEQSFIEAYDFQAFNNHITNKWRGLFKGIARANDALNTLKKVEQISDEKRNRIIGEARFLRGFFHMEARKMWRNPPYISDEVFDINDVESTKVPNDIEIWPLIEADFQDAINRLPEVQNQIGRPTKWAAMAFLAKAKMYQGWDANGNPNSAKLQEAKQLLDQIVNSNRFSLVDKFEDNFLVATRNNRESIFEIQYAINSANDQASNQGVGLAHPYTDPWGCCGFYQASQNLVNAYKTNSEGLPLLDSFNDSDVTWQTEFTGPLDPRLDHTLGRPGILFKDFKIHGTDFIRDLSYAGPYSSKKHVSEAAGFGVGGWGNLTANNYRIMRYSMILLWLAEAEVEIGSLERARELVNTIRRRAANPAGFVPKAIQGSNRNDYTIVPGQPAANYKISTYNSPWADKNTARKAVRFETRLEFAMEGHRFFDLQRWGVSAEVLNAYLNVEKTKRVYLSNAVFTKGKNEFYPIPIQAIDRSLKDGVPTLKQDPAY
ncbi:RagB/SusD family nutrient uptake outer membrane protein [Algoriphagus sp. NBT04N3]|jgi:starch-binding outer membrane protein, SusD/RagB family|uniref:RagB/SusD family nutrient uptake outer membrane protein n=1 Tax=Algoriphagus sp. NBT04N3 TaxID=2705473 RepID=UPI001C631F57|nr:RagB/SusD family nutrient uptake outer membrane protein [Algoriphagus sp. NBT04N3]QYH37567.1 RagB/SusD family nutrient uptake outer membrane protein [Algoriphagus sp. NBT04N3]